MNYIRCINNKAYLRVPDEAVNGVLGDLTLGAVYKVLPTSPQERDTACSASLITPGKTISTRRTTFNRSTGRRYRLSGSLGQFLPVIQPCQRHNQLNQVLQSTASSVRSTPASGSG